MTSRNNKRYLILFICLFFMSAFFSNLVAQVIYTSLNSDVYEYLDRMSMKGVIDYHDEVLPLSRKQIASFLGEIRGEREKLNDLEKNELKWYLEEYNYELGLEDQFERFRVLSYTDTMFQARFSPVAGYTLSNYGGESGHERLIGFDVIASYGDWFGMNLRITDHGEFGDNVDRGKIFSPRTGAFNNAILKNGIEHNEVNGSISFNWKWGSVSLRKGYNKWGHGNFGQLILSEKAPAFPHVLLSLQPADWLRFHYIHGQLTSNVIDSSASYYTDSDVKPVLREDFIDKFIVGNIISFTPWDILDVSAGNMFIYSGDFRMEMWIPFLFYKWLDHNTGQAVVNDGNGQLFLDLLLKYPETFNFYSTLFLETVSIRDYLDGDFEFAWFGFTLGMEKTGLYFDNLSSIIEYTHIRPWVYEHKDPTTTYKHLDYELGHWIGQNADQLRLQLNYRVMHNLDISIFAEQVRKGGLKDIAYGYSEGDENEEFLYGKVRNDFRSGLGVSYQPLHDLSVRASYQYADVDEEDADNPRTPSFMKGENNVFRLSASYGL